MTDLFTATATPTPTGVLVRFAGQLDADTAPRARQVVADLALSRGALLVLDLGALEFCDSSGISVLLAARNAATAADAGIALVAVPARLSRTFALIGLDGVFATHATVADAVAAWS